jgi:beta-alanine--pyruvate transaminase
VTSPSLANDAYWMAFTPNRHFRADPRIIVRAEGLYLIDQRGRRIFDGLSGLWCCGLGHAPPALIEAMRCQATALDYAPAFQFAHQGAFDLANRLTAIAPAPLAHVFFTNAGSDAVDTALKLARAFWRARGRPSKTKFIGRERGYHGANFAGVSVGGIGANRRDFGQGLDADHIQHTQVERHLFERGLPPGGADLADDLLRLIALHDASNIAALIVEPLAGSAGVIPPPADYLARLRAICDHHDILLVFDEVITGFGRTGAMFGAETFSVTPDIITVAKQITNGLFPMGAALVTDDIHDAVLASQTQPHLPEFFHGYTYSAHPIACAVALATLDAIDAGGVLARVRTLAPILEDAIHALKDAPHVLDVRNYGLAAGITVASDPSAPGRRAMEVALACWERGFYVRWGGDTLQLAPPFIAEPGEIEAVGAALGDVLASQR